MEYDGYIEVELPIERTNKDWLKASDASLAKLQEVGTKIYNLGIADTRQLRVNKNNLHAKTELPQGTKCAWGSNGSIPDLLRKHNERQRQQKATRPVSAKVTTHNQPTKTRRRPQSAKELGIQEAAQEKKPPTGLGVKGMHRDLEERPPGGIGVGVGAGWAAPPGGVLDMSGREIDDLLSQVSDSQRPSRSQAAWQQQGSTSGIPPPPRGSPDFSKMLDTKNGQGPTFRSMIEDLLFDQNTLPSEILTRPPPEPIHISMPHVTLGGETDPSDSMDAEEENQTSDRRTPPVSSGSRPGYKQKSTFLDINMNNFNDTNPWQSCDETDDEEILLEASPRRTPLRMRTVTFNEEKNETTLITPRGAKSHREAQEELERLNNDLKSSAATSGYDVLEDRLPKQHKVTKETQGQVELPKPKTYQGRADLKWVKSRTDSGVALTSQDEGGKGVGRKGSAGKVRTGAGNSVTAEDRGNTVPTVSVAYFEDLGPEEDTKATAPTASGKSRTKKTRQAHLEEVETMVSRVAAEAEEKREDLELVGNKSGTSEVQWATPESVKTKVVSSGAQKNYYELALQARMAKHRSQVTAKEDDSKKTKTIKTFEFGDGEVIEHKTVSTVDTLQHQKKEYVVPKDARPQSASTKTVKQQDSAESSTKDPSLDRTSSVNSEQYTESGSSSQSKMGDDGSKVETGKPTIQVNGVTQSQRPNSSLHLGIGTGSSRPGSSRGNRMVTSSTDRSVERPSSRQGSRNEPQKSAIRDSKKETRTSIQTDHLYDEFQNVRLKAHTKQRAVSAPVRRGPTIENGKLTGAGSGLGILASSPYAAPAMKPRPYSASVVHDMKKRPGSANNIKISTKLSYREIQRVKSAAKLVKKGTLGHPKVYNTEKHYANYSKPPPPTPIVPILRKKKMEAAASAAAAATEKEKKETSIVQMWTRQDDFEVETEGIQECKKLQDKLLEQGVPVTLDTLTRALLPPGECAMRGSTYVTSTNPTLPEDTSRLLSKPAIWFPEEFNRLQRARKLAQRAELSVHMKDDWDDRNMYMQSSMSNSTTNKKTKKKKKKKKAKSEDLMSRSSSGY